jgi:adenylate kinase
MTDRLFPPIGTPGTGKSTTAALLASTSSIPLRHLNISDIVKEHSFHEGWDEEWSSWTLDEDRVSHFAW